MPMVLQVAAGAAVASGALMAYAVRSPRSSLLSDAKWIGHSGRRSIALTFDDGPSESTARLLDLLAEHDARATFFQCGANVRRLPAIARQIAGAGHEIGNHSDTHPFLHFRSTGFMRRQIAAAQRAIEVICGVSPRVFRPPYGVRWFGLGAVEREAGLTEVTWSLLALDWKRSPQTVATRVARASYPGAIICLHDGRELQPDPDISVTLEALRLVLPQLRDQGVAFETVSQILCPTN
jgi:peptidoglycan/xylan/chitin deacetylase (PgdA/CDA1 family)